MANNTAGIVGRFGQSSFTSISASKESNGQRRLPPKKPSKFFKSRNVPEPVSIENYSDESELENIAEEEEEEDPTYEREFASSLLTPCTTNNRSHATPGMSIEDQTYLV